MVLKETYNTKLYGKMVLRYFPDINEHDYYLLCNKLSKMYKDINDPCNNNWRICKSENGKDITPEYRERRSSGCCGTYDKKIYNEVTGNTYFIGCNYGH